MPTSLFTAVEIEALEKFGPISIALMSGKNVPRTPTELRFLEVCKGTKVPLSLYEKLWVRFIKRKIWECENPDSAGNEDKVFADAGITGIGWGIYDNFR